VTIKDREMRYYKEDKQGRRTLCGVINFDLYNVTLEKDKKEHSFYLRILNCDRVFQWRTEKNKTADGKDLMLEWLGVIQMHI